MRYALLVALSLLCGCTHIDTGEVDYRIAEPQPTPNATATNTPAALALRKEPLLPAPIFRKYKPADTEEGKAFEEGEVYSVDLEQVVIGDNILEGQILGQQFGDKGEFAILANVFEFAATADEATKKRFVETAEYNRKPGDNGVQLKLVYYGDDVRRRQALNFDNVVIKPRDKYNGGSIGIQFVIMELDVKSGPMTSLLTTLADSSKDYFPGPPELKGLLTNLGASLFKGGNTDDRLFDYRMVLSTKGFDPQEPKAVFAPGRYVFRRAQVRGKDLDWSNVQLDHNTGRLYEKTAGGWTDVRNELYLVVNVRRYPKDTQTEYYTHPEWTAFRDSVQKLADDEAMPLTDVVENVRVLAAARRTENWRVKLMRKWATAEGQLVYYASRAISGDMPQLAVADGKAIACPGEFDFKRRRDMAAQNTRDALLAFIAEYQRAVAAGKAPAMEFENSDQNALVSQVARYFMPWSDQEAAAPFENGASFNQAFITGVTPDRLVTLAMATALTRTKKAESCAELPAG